MNARETWIANEMARILPMKVYYLTWWDAIRTRVIDGLNAAWDEGIAEGRKMAPPAAPPPPPTVSFLDRDDDE